MVYHSRARKRTYAIRRAPDGSAFQKCDVCGVTVAVALIDMHDCENHENTTKKRKFECQTGEVEIQRTHIHAQDQPRSAFQFFMEEFVETREDGNEMEMTKIGWEAWMNMSKEERLPFIHMANKLNSEHCKRLREEENAMMMELVDEEADSAEVGKYDESYDELDTYSFDSESYDGSGCSFDACLDAFATLLRHLS